MIAIFVLHDGSGVLCPVSYSASNYTSVVALHQVLVACRRDYRHNSNVLNPLCMSAGNQEGLAVTQVADRAQVQNISLQAIAFTEGLRCPMLS